MTEIETSRHLYQLPRYRTRGGGWHDTWTAALAGSGARLTLEPAAVLSLLAFNYVCGDLTLLREVSRRPWLSSVGMDGEPILEPIPPHGLRWPRLPEIAAELGRRLHEEAARVCSGRSHLYVLLSGGLDSRVIAATLARLLREGRLATKPVAVTWGLPESRDVVYGREAARILGFDWIHLPLGPQHIVENVEDCARLLGSLVSPLHLHRMTWFRSAPRDALVLAASYGDMISRAESSGKWILELEPLRPSNPFELLRAGILEEALEGLDAALRALRARAPGRPVYATCEHEMQGHYMRGLIAHSLSVITQFCDVYQMFTDPDVYAYMWSLHPSLRTDAVYAVLLEGLHPDLARLPWARNNRALRGRTVGARPGLLRDFHDYPNWISGPVHGDLAAAVDPGWFSATGLFDPDRVRSLTRLVREGPQGPVRAYGSHPYELFVWLISFRRLIEGITALGRTVRFDQAPGHRTMAPSVVPADRMSRIRRLLSRSRMLYRAVRVVRRRLLKIEARIRYRPRR